MLLGSLQLHVKCIIFKNFSAFIFGKCCPDAAFTRSLSLRNFWCKAPEQCLERERCTIFRSPEAVAICIRLAPKVAAEQFFHRIVHSVRPFMHFFLCAHAYRTMRACDPKPRRRLHAMHVPAASQLGGRRTTSSALTSTHVRVSTYGEAEKNSVRAMIRFLFGVVRHRAAQTDWRLHMLAEARLAWFYWLRS
jgi:hypothetical protein